MDNETTAIKARKVVLPTWLDTLIFDDLSARYCRQNKDMVVLECDSDYVNLFVYSVIFYPKRRTYMKIAKNYPFLILVVVLVVN